MKLGSSLKILEQHSIFSTPNPTSVQKGIVGDIVGEDVGPIVGLEDG